MTTRKRITYNTDNITVTEGNESLSIFSLDVAPLYPNSAIFVEAKAIGRTSYGATVIVVMNGTLSINSGVLVDQGNQTVASGGASGLLSATGVLSDDTTSNNLDVVITGVNGFTISWSYWINIYSKEI